MSEKKVVRGTIALTLGLLCVALVGSLLGTLWYYTSMVNEKNNIIATRDSQISQQSSQISQLNLQITGLQSQLADFSNIVSLTKSETWINSQTTSQPPGSYSAWSWTPRYAGYVTVSVESSTTDKTFVQIVYNSYGITYDERMSVGSGGTVVFPVVPAFVEIRIGNTNYLNGATETATIVFHY